MNKWFNRAVGAIGVASGALLLSSGVAHAGAADEAKPTVDPQAMRGLVADLFTPTGGQHHLGLSIDEQTQREEFISGLLGGSGGGGPLAGLTSGLGGLTGGSGGASGLLGGLGGLGGLTGGLTGDGGGLGGLTGGLTGGGGPLGGLPGGELLGGLTGGGNPLGGLTGGLTGDGGPLGTVTGGLTNGDGAVGGLTSRLTGRLFGGGDKAQAPAGLDPAMLDMLTDDQLGLVQPGPASTDLIDPSLRGTPADTTGQQAVQLDPDVARQVNDLTSPLMSAMIADAIAQRMGLAAGEFVEEPADVEENLPVVGGLPVIGDLLGPDGPLGGVLVVGDFTNGIPLVGPALNGNLGPDSLNNVPVVSQLLNRGLLNTGQGGGLPLVGGLPFIGDALKNTMKAGPSVIPVNQQPTSVLPRTAPQQVPAGAQTQKPAADPMHVGRHRTTDRPELTDPDYLESGSLPLVGSLTGASGVGTLPLTSLVRDSGLPLVGDLGGSLRMLKSLPLVGTLTGLLDRKSVV